MSEKNTVYLDKEKTIELITLIKMKDYENFLVYYFFYSKVVPDFFIILKKIQRSDALKIINYILEIEKSHNERLTDSLKKDSFYEALGIDLNKILKLKEKL